MRRGGKSSQSWKNVALFFKTRENVSKMGIGAKEGKKRSMKKRTETSFQG